MNQIETFLLQTLDMSQRQTDFIILGVGGLTLVGITILVIGTIAIYLALLATSYIRMVYSKHARDRRKWSIVFITALIIGLTTVAKFFI